MAVDATRLHPSKEKEAERGHFCRLSLSLETFLPTPTTDKPKPAKAPTSVFLHNFPFDYHCRASTRAFLLRERARTLVGTQVRGSTRPSRAGSRALGRSVRSSLSPTAPAERATASKKSRKTQARETEGDAERLTKNPVDPLLRACVWIDRKGTAP